MSSNCGNFVSGIEILYDDDQPGGTINEIHGQSADINKGQGGSYVWLRIQRATRPSDMVSSFAIERGDVNSGRPDLAKGAGGDYRYLVETRGQGSERKINDVGLWRSDDKQEQPPAGWDGMTTDVNDGRGGDYLYVIWKTQRYTG
ncbi:hypothetical protein B0J13DRAFT_560135 [Dactylonectria estremocensis]|uniref:Uncharacterized protein n=1 Tax=Dactylonectria estremocensis TaxID=1079267 RepID=A0A9P9EGU2_9HYPO|nr:hypothetical protein B0J13DRAFT_560135 [Dactylonectria estremocensis]